MSNKRTLIYGHRGASEVAPENTMAAFEYAKMHKADGIELDVQLTKDGKLVVIHDDLVDRTSDGHGRVSDMYYDDLRKLDFGSWKSDIFTNQRLPLFDDVAKYAKENDMLINIEIKPSLLSDTIEDMVVDICAKHDIVYQSVVSSFNHFALLNLKTKFPMLQTGIIYKSGMVNVGKYATEQVLADSIHPYYIALVEPTIDSARKYNQKIRTWTVDDENIFLHLASIDILEAIITNRPLAMYNAYENARAAK